MTGHEWGLLVFGGSIGVVVAMAYAGAVEWAVGRHAYVRERARLKAHRAEEAERQEIEALLQAVVDEQKGTP